MVFKIVIELGKNENWSQISMRNAFFCQKYSPAAAAGIAVNSIANAVRIVFFICLSLIYVKVKIGN